MNYKSIIEFETDSTKDVLKIFEPEILDFKNERSSYIIQEDKNCIKFIIQAKDSVSLRATLNAITKLLTVYERLK